jgi:hypothetical protein
LNHPDYPQFDNQFSSHSSNDYPPKQSSLEETLKEFMELIGQPTIPALQEPSLATEPFILENHSSLPLSYNHPPQESLVQHFSTANVDDLKERVNQLMEAGQPIPNLLTLTHLISHVNIVIVLLTSLMIALS